MKSVISLLVIFLLGHPSIAQPQNKPELEALRIAFISKQLALTPQQAEKFWPVHNHYEATLKTMQQEQRQKKESELVFQQKVLDFRKQSKTEFLKCISEEQFDKLMQIERNWGEMLRKELQRRKQQREGNAGGRRFQPANEGN